LRRVFEGTGGLSVVAAAMVFVGTVFLLAILISPGSWEWWSGKQVMGNEQNGVVYYSYQGRNYSLDDVNSFRTGPRPVWFDPSNPSNAVLTVAVARVSDTALTAGPYALALVFLAAGFRRRRRNRRRQQDPSFDPFIAYGEGIDQVTIDRILSEKRAREQRGSAPAG
jgi:hypothetical protein